MQSRDLKQIEKFLDIVGKDSLFVYYKLPEEAPDEEFEVAIRKRRGWAQGQQANPKYRSEAMWIIKNSDLVRRALIDQRPDYATSARERVSSASLQALTPFIQGILAAGALSAEGERAILKQGAALGLSEAQTRAHLASLYGERPPVQESPAEEAFVDYYTLLQVAPTASFEALEAAHRARYRWARNLKNREESSRTYALLDRAWRALDSPEKRAAYDAERAQQTDLPTDEAARRPPPPPSPIPEPPTDERAAPSGAPPPPAGLGDKTLGLDSKKPTSRHSELAIASPEVVQIKVASKPLHHTIVIKNSGLGRMPGRISSDRKWLEISRSRLDPDASEQSIDAIIHPGRMPRRSAVALVSIITDHGQRRAITFRVERRSLLVPLLGAVALLLAVLLVFELTTHLGASP